MTYRFKLQEPIAEGARRIGLEQIEMAAAKLAGKEDVPAAIHDARRSLKRLRALLRLIRPGMADSVYRREAERLSSIGRMLAGARDQHVMQLTLDKLEGRFGPIPGGGAARLRKLLAERRANGRDAGGHARRDSRRDALAGLERARRLFAGRALAKVGLEHAVDGLEIAYRKARKAFREAYREPGDETFHVWRKRVQQHWRHMALLSRGWPEAMSARAGEAKELSRLLGEDHDYAVLLHFAEAQADRHLRLEDLTALSERCRMCQSELRAEARPRGERLFAERAADLSDRVTLYWTSAAHLAALAPPDGKATDGKARPQMRRRKPGVAKGAAPAGASVLARPRYRRRKAAEA